MPPTHTAELLVRDILNRVYEVNSLALARACWLDNPILLAVVSFHFLRQLSVFLRQNEGLRNEGEVPFAIDALHSREVRVH